MRTSYLFYTDAEEAIPAPRGAVTLTVKLGSDPAQTYPVVDGAAILPTGTTAARGYYQFYATTGAVLETGTIEIKLSLARAGDSYDPRSQAEITLEALDAKIAGRALTIQQSKVTVGDRSIEYMNSIDELLRWRDHFARVVAIEQGRRPPIAEVCRLVRA